MSSIKNFQTEDKTIYRKISSMTCFYSIDKDNSTYMLINIVSNISGHEDKHNIITSKDEEKSLCSDFHKWVKDSIKAIKFIYKGSFSTAWAEMHRKIIN